MLASAMSNWVTVTEAAALAGVSEHTVRRWVKRDRPTAARRGQALMIRVAELTPARGHPDSPDA